MLSEPQSFGRSLKLDDSSAAFMARAGPQLLSLDCARRPDDSDIQHPAYAEMTALTRMKLSGFPCPANSPPLPGLLLPNLVELSLINCSCLPQYLIRAGALTSLRKLDITGEVSFHPEHQSDDSSAAVEVQRLKSLGDIVTSLPSLTHISGNSNLFHCGMVDSLRDWTGY